MESCSLRIAQPERAAKTDSKLIKSDATVGGTCFCPIIWNVYARPQEKIPAYNIGKMQERISLMWGVSNMSMKSIPTAPETRNCRQASFMPSALVAK